MDDRSRGNRQFFRASPSSNVNQGTNLPGRGLLRRLTQRARFSRQLIVSASGVRRFGSRGPSEPAKPREQVRSWSLIAVPGPDGTV